VGVGGNQRFAAGGKAPAGPTWLNIPKPLCRNDLSDCYDRETGFRAMRFANTVAFREISLQTVRAPLTSTADQRR